ncbi:uncharacterized protein LOC131944640 isoform X2 [Physella acuta]|uniref:uncharacterized protein LOC131944640 isoform X2 n=1 Tax=Physella acuta TaxID=109671 RepID=UPI0027DC6F7D|nr:uncharacterized protein LOC131944640 isoform X2 [Physella acuta]
MGTAASASREDITYDNSAVLVKSLPALNSRSQIVDESNSGHHVQVTKDGFIPSEVVLTEGEEITLYWDDAVATATNLVQVVNDGEKLRPVVGGYGGVKGLDGTFKQMFNLEGQYKFSISQIRCTPFTVTVKKRLDHFIEVTDEGFSPSVLHIGQGQVVRWSWKSCSTPHKVTEVYYSMESRCFRQGEKEQSNVATSSGTHRQQFKKPGLYYFQTEKPDSDKFHLCIVHVKYTSNEYKIEVLDQTFSPMILLVEEGDRVWWEWNREKCKKLHHIYQMDAPSCEEQEDSPYQPTQDGFKWPHNPSKQGLMSHKFTKHGVYYYSDQNYDEAAMYIGTIIVRPRVKEHIIQVKESGFDPDILRVNTGDLVWMSWPESNAGRMNKILRIDEEQKVVSPPAPEADKKQTDNIEDEDLRRMTQAGLAFANFSNIGVYTYKLCDKTNTLGTCSVIVNPGPKNHTIYVTDSGFEPDVITIRPNDRVWWMWQNTKKQHNIVQVSHEIVPIPDGFCSGLPRDSPSAYHHQFTSVGVFYFHSHKIPQKFGSIVVAPQSHVHEVEVSNKTSPTVTVNVTDIVCWTRNPPVTNDVIQLKNLDMAFHPLSVNDLLPNKRSCIAKNINELGITPFYSLSFKNLDNNIMAVVSDERCDYAIIRVNKRGFHPKEIFLQKGKSVLWTWKETDGEHNIIHVTDPKNNAQLKEVTNIEGFSSGRIIEKSSFLYTFDKCGDYAVVSQGAPGFSCVVHIKEPINQTTTPKIVTDSVVQTADGFKRLKLECETKDAEIHYTTDGSLPALHLDNTMRYKPDKGITLKESGVIRAIAVKNGEICSFPLTSGVIWVEPKDGVKKLFKEESEVLTDAEEPEDPEKQSLWVWWGCRPYIRGCLTDPGTIEVFWELPKPHITQEHIKGYNIFLNGVCYCPMFPPTNNSVNISGLAGGRSYKIYVKAYPKDPQNVAINSNNLHLKCPVETEEIGPVISLVQTEKKDSIAVVWMSIDKPDRHVNGYLVFLNDQQCGPKLVPNPNSNRCKVVIESCDLNAVYKVFVKALLTTSEKSCISNVLEVKLPLETGNFVYPPDEEKEDGEDIYIEYLEVTEGSGYMSQMDDPDNPIWETETDSTSGQDDSETASQKKTHQKRMPDQDKDQVFGKELQKSANLIAVSGLVKSDDQKPTDDSVASSETESVTRIQDDQPTIFWDASRNMETSDQTLAREADFSVASAFKESDMLVNSDEFNSPKFKGAGLAVIEVQKNLAPGLKDAPDSSKSSEETSMIRVNEGEFVQATSDGVLPAPAIMAKSLSRSNMLIGWSMPSNIDPQYIPRLFVVNVIGTKFTSKINSDISFECNIVENGKQVRGVQHCWNLEDKYHCMVHGLVAGHTYRIYVVGNFSLAKEDDPCEIQTTSSVLYYTTVGAPRAPTIRATRVDLNQCSLEWFEENDDSNVKVTGYQLYVDGKPLGGRRNNDVRQMVINNLVPGKTLSISVAALSEFGGEESESSPTLRITCPAVPPVPIVSQQPSYKRGSVLIAWTKPEAQDQRSNEETITFYSIFIDNKWHGEVKANPQNDKQGYQFYLTDLSSEQSYDVSVKAVAGERVLDTRAQHIYCLSASPMSNIIPVMAPAAPKSPKLRLEGLHPEGIDVTWVVPQQCGDAYISGYQMLKNGKLYGSIIPPDVNSLRIRDVTLGEKIELQLIALTEHPVGKSDRKSEMDKDSGRGSSQQDEKTTDIFNGDHYSGCKPGPKLVVHYTGLVSAPVEVWCEKATGHSLLIVWKKTSDSKAHFLRPDSYQVTWWPGDRPQDEIQSDSTTEDHLLISGLRPSTAYTVVVEARKMEKYTDLDEGFSMNETPDGLNAFILSSKSEQLHVRTASPPDPPSNIGVIAMTCHSLKVGWDPPKEHGSEIIGIRVECVSRDHQDKHIVSVDTLPDATYVDVTGLNEKTDYVLKVIAVTEEFFDQLPDKNGLKERRGFPPNVLASSEESLWLPSSSIVIKTSGTEAPGNIHVIKATTTSLTLNWVPPLVYGSNKLTGQIVRWSDVKNPSSNDIEDLQIASHVKLLPNEDTLTIDGLSPGGQYKITIEAVVSVKTSLDPDQWDGHNIEKNRRTAHVPSKPLVARTRAPIESPCLLVTSYTQNSATLYWEKPPLLSVVGKDPEGNPKCLRRYLLGYKLEINGKLQSCFGPDSNSCTLTKCKPGRTYKVVLVAMTCTEQDKINKKQKYKNINSEETDFMTLLQDDPNLDESPSDTLEITLPKNQEGFIESLEAKFVEPTEENSGSFGSIELTWKVQGSSNQPKQFSIIWYSMDDRVIQTKYAGPDQRRCTVPVTRLKTMYRMKIEASYYTDVLPQHGQEVQVMTPGPPDAPQIFLRSVEPDEFCIEWGEPRLYGGVEVKGYQVFLNDKKAGGDLSAKHTKATIPCRANRTYRVCVVAVSSKPLYGDSQKSNTLVINPSGHSSSGLTHEESVVEELGIPVKIVKVTETSIQLDWSQFTETDQVAGYKIQWSSVAQPSQREVKLSKADTNCVINKCLPGTTHFVRVVGLATNGQIIEKSKQLTIQTSAPPDAPQLSVRACNFRYIAIQWEKPTTYGEAYVVGYKVYVNGVVEEILNADQLSYTYTQGKWCREYVFQVQALTAGDTLNSKPSDPLVVTWPGSRAPYVKRLPSLSSSTLRVSWEEPYLTEGLKVKHYKLCCEEAGTEKLVQTVGPIHPECREGEIKNLKKGDYNVYLEVYLYGTDTVIRSESLSMQPAVSPDPPRITLTVVGLDDRRQIEKFTCDLVNKRDRLIRRVGHKLKKLGTLSYPLRSEKNEDVVLSAHALTRIEELMEDCFSALDTCTGQLSALVSWQCPQSNPDIQISEFKVLVDGKQYGSPIHSGIKTLRIQLGLDQPSYKISMVAASSKPQGTSEESNVIEVLSTPFKPFTFYCYHGIHKQDAKYPASGCCKFQDSIVYERQVAKKLANQGLLSKQVPLPSCNLYDIFDGEFKPLMSTHKRSCPTAILFWTPWCLASQKYMDSFIRYARENTAEMSFVAVACGPSKPEEKKLLRHTITTNNWFEDKSVWHITSECDSHFYKTQNSRSRDSKVEADKTGEKPMDLAELLGIAGVPTLLFIHPDGYIAWHGRYCALEYSAFESFMRHTVSEVLKQPCFVANCDCCKSDTTIDEVMALQLPNVVAVQTRHRAHRAQSPSCSSELSSRLEMKFASLNGITSNAGGTERIFVAEVPKHRSPEFRKKRSPSPRMRSKKNNLSINKRPYSACCEAHSLGMLEKSPYLACVAPHIHHPHKVLPRPASAKKLMHYV